MKSVIAFTLVFAVGISANCTPVEISPVCGSNGRTYTDLCDLLDAKENDVNFNLISNNACPLPPCIRSALSGLVCGSDGQFYNDVCDLLEAKHNNFKFTTVNKLFCSLVGPITISPWTLTPIDIVVEKDDI